MYSVTFALTAFFGIAVMNLFLGFAAALLIGRGPRRWADVDQLITFRPFSPSLFLLRSKPAAQLATVTRVAATSAAPSAAAAPVASPTASAPPSAAPAKEPAKEPAAEKQRADATTDAPRHTPRPALQGPEKKLVLEPLSNAKPVDDRSADEVLADQLQQWRTEEDHEEMPAITMLRVIKPTAENAGDAHGALLRAIRKTITSQLRRDRVVLIFEQGEFVWFADDMQPEDAVMPAERIRQLIVKTRFEHGDDVLDVLVATALVAATEDDDTAKVLDRLRVAIQVAQDGEGSVAINLGDGPKPVESLELEIVESVEVLDQ